MAVSDATFIIVDNLGPHFRVKNTVIRGAIVYDYNATHFIPLPHIEDIEGWVAPNRFVSAPITVDDLQLDIKRGDTIHIIRASDGSLLTGHDEVRQTGDPLTDSNYPWKEVQKIVVYNRYQHGAKPMVGLIRGFDITDGAIAGSVAHDCHNIVAIGSSDEYLVKAVNRVVEMQGGLVVVSADELLDIPLPIAGLMTPLDGYEIAFRMMLMHEMVRSIGCTMKSPFITMSFMALPVIPVIKITDRHLVDTKNMRIIE
jgi:adenine deaminase